jgi:hypothetical protein
MREKCNKERDSGEREFEVCADRSQVDPLRKPAPSRHNPGEKWEKGGHCNRGQDECAP